jgi:hypothetical protein
MSVVPKSDDGTVQPGGAFHKWGEVSLAAGDAFGKSLRTVDEAKQNMINAGFVEVAEHRFKWPIGSTFETLILLVEHAALTKRVDRLAQGPALKADWHVQQAAVGGRYGRMVRLSAQKHSALDPGRGGCVSGAYADRTEGQIHPCVS